LAGCTQFQTAREQYLETRVVELLDEMDATDIPVAATATEDVVEATATEEETAEATEAATEEATEEATVEATEEATAEPTEENADEATATPTDEGEEAKGLIDPKAYLGESDWEDNMTAVGNWSLITDEYLSATYDAETLMIKALTTAQGWRIASTEALVDAYVEASIKVDECSGADAYGLIFRVPENVDYRQGYIFTVTCDGKYALRKWDGLTGAKGEMVDLQGYTESSLVNDGENQTNRLGVMFVDDRILLYINGEKAGEVTDDSFSRGYFGVYLDGDKTDDLTIYVDDVMFWENPEIQ
jgi:hypothetical protein